MSNMDDEMEVSSEYKQDIRLTFKFRIKVKKVAESYADLEIERLDKQNQIFDFESDHDLYQMIPAIRALIDADKLQFKADYCGMGFERGYADLGLFWISVLGIENVICAGDFVDFNMVMVYERLRETGELPWLETLIEDIAVTRWTIASKVN